MKINIVGTSGSGKSTLARRMAAELALPYIEMDTCTGNPTGRAPRITSCSPGSKPCSTPALAGCWTATITAPVR